METDKETAEMAKIDHKQIILKRSLRAHLLEEVDTEKVMTHLARSKAMTKMDREMIKEIHTRKGKTEMLLRIIAHKEEVYEEFVKALEDDKCFVAFYILKEEREYILSKLEEKTEKLEEMKNELSFEKRKLEALEEKNTNLQDKLKEITEKLGEAEEISKNLLLEKQKAALEEEKLEAQLREDTTIIRQTLVTSDHIQDICDEIGSAWKDLGIKLSLEPSVVNNIEHDYSLCRERAWQVLDKWKEGKGSGATLGVLIDVLELIGKKSTADKLFGMEKKSKEIACVRAQSARFQSEVGQLRKSLQEEEQKHKKTWEELRECKEKLQKLGSTSRSVEPQNSEKVTKQPLHLEGMEIRSIEISYVREQSARFQSEVGQLRKSLPEVKEHKKSLEELEEGKEKLGSTSRSVEPQNSEKVTKQPLHLEALFQTARNVDMWETPWGSKHPESENEFETGKFQALWSFSL